MVHSKPSFYEFFAGGGMARAGLGEGWTCLFANDLCPIKAKTYAANWGGGEFRLGDIHALTPADLPGHADLAWASFPCQDLSLAGGGAGLKGARSGAFWGLWDLLDGLGAEDRLPRMVVLENVVGTLSANKGEDFHALCHSLCDLGYRFGALVIDAAHFLPHSRPRLFIVCVERRADVPTGVLTDGPAAPWCSNALRAAYARLPASLREDWLWWRLPPPPQMNRRLADLIEDEPADISWHSAEETQRFLDRMSDANRAKLCLASASGGRTVGTIYRRTRPDKQGGKTQRAEVRFDGIAGCLRTPGGGSSKQFLVVIEGERMRTRLLSGREAARLMGLPESYVLPSRHSEAWRLLGDGLAVHAVRHLREHVLSTVVAPTVEPRIAA